MPVHPLVLLHSSLPLFTAQLVLKPAPHALPIGHPCFLRHVVSKVAEPLTECKHAQALALARPREQGVELRAERLAHWRSDRRQFLRELVERVAEAEAETRLRKQGPQTLRSAVKAIGQDSPDPIRWLLLERRLLERSIRLGKGRRTGLLGVPQMPEHAATDDRGEVHFLD